MKLAGVQAHLLVHVHFRNVLSRSYWTTMYPVYFHLVRPAQAGSMHLLDAHTLMVHDVSNLIYSWIFTRFLGLHFSHPCQVYPSGPARSRDTRFARSAIALGIGLSVLRPVAHAFRSDAASDAPLWSQGRACHGPFPTSLA